MSQLRNPLGRRIAVEAAWLLVHWGFSFAFAAWLLGFKQVFEPTLDIQMHNTYFVIPGALIPLPIFLLEATFITGIRMVSSGFQDRLIASIFVVLTVLLTGFLFWLTQAFH